MGPKTRQLLVAGGCAGVAFLGVALMISTYWPGLMSPDSWDQLGQARTQVYRPWHPPLMAWTWHWFDLVLPGPGAMMVFGCAMLWGGLAVIAAVTIRRTPFGGLALLIGVWPPVFIL